MKKLKNSLESNKEDNNTKNPQPETFTREERPKKRKRLSASRFLFPWTTTSFREEAELQKRLSFLAFKRAKSMVHDLSHKGEILDFESENSLWNQLGIHSEFELNDVLTRLSKRKTLFLFITIFCGLLFLLSLFLKLQILALLLAFVLMIEGGVEYTKVLWRIECIKKNSYIPFKEFLFGNAK